METRSCIQWIPRWMQSGEGKPALPEWKCDGNPWIIVNKTILIVMAAIIMF